MQVAYQSDIGKKRHSNQDAVGAYVNQSHAQLLLIADGMGGHQGGDVAASLTIANLGHLFVQTDLNTIVALNEWLVEVLHHENQQIYQIAQHNQNLRGMGTTVVAIIVLNNKYIVAHVGDSRAYCLHQQHFLRLTQDHSLVNELIKQGDLTPQEAQYFPQRNIITRSLGVDKNVDIDVDVYSLQPHDLLLLCSDGLTNMVSDDQIAAVLQDQSKSLQERVDQLVTMANDAGGSDNITVLVAQSDEGYE